MDTVLRREIAFFDSKSYKHGDELSPVAYNVYKQPHNFQLFMGNKYKGKLSIDF